MAHYPYCFTIDRLSLQVHLGWQAPERSAKQAVAVGLRIYFQHAPECMGDDNGRFLDYHALSNLITYTAESREYRLIEYMAAELFAAARGYVDASAYSEAKLWLSVRKCDAPVDKLEGGAGFVMSDLPAGAGVVESR